MYFRDSAACNQPSSTSPMPQLAIDEQDAMMAGYALPFVVGDKTFNDLVVALGGNPAGAAVSALGGNAGVPTTGVFTPSAPTYGNPVNRSGGNGSGGNRFSNNGGPRCTDPTVLPLVTVFPIPIVMVPQSPAAAPAAPASAPSFGPPPAVAPRPEAPAASLDPKSCRTSNFCIDLRDGCVSSTQVTVEQQFACAMKGYSGNANRYPAIAALPNKPFLGTPYPNPVPYDPSMDAQARGLTGWQGLGDANEVYPSVPGWVWVAGLIGVAAIARGSFGFGKTARRNPGKKKRK